MSNMSLSSYMNIAYRALLPYQRYIENTPEDQCWKLTYRRNYVSRNSILGALKYFSVISNALDIPEMNESLENSLSNATEERIVKTLENEIDKLRNVLVKMDTPQQEIALAEGRKALLIYFENLLPPLKASEVVDLMEILYRATIDPKKESDNSITTFQKEAIVLLDQLDNFETSLGEKYTWQDYQILCERIMNYCFVPPLELAIREKKTEDSTQRPDMILPNNSSDGFWLRLFHEYNANLIFVEVKSTMNPLGTNEVRQLRNYFHRVKGRFGLLISPRGLCQTGMNSVIRYLLDDNSLVISLSNDDLIKLLETKRQGGNSEDILIKKRFEILSNI